MNSKYYIADCELGKGVFAAKHFRVGEPIFTFSGPIITLQEVVAKGDKSANPVQIDKSSYIDVEPPGVFINHSCDPNAGVVQDRVVVALRPLRKEEQVCFDYSTTMSETHWTMPCRCGNSLCRSIVRDFHEIPLAAKLKYLALGVVQQFIVAECQGLMNPTAMKLAQELSAVRVRRPTAGPSGDPASDPRFFSGLLKALENPQ